MSQSRHRTWRAAIPVAWVVTTCAVLALGFASSLRAADAEAGKAKAHACVFCHGPTGASLSPDTPSIAGQQSEYIFLQLVQFREERRLNPLMKGVVAGLSDKDLEDLAAYFSAQKPALARVHTDPAKVAAGRLVSEREHCESCHLPRFVGQKQVPRLLGQHPEYILKQLRGFKTQTQSDIDGAMTTAAQPLSDQDIENVANYIASLTPAH